jgi:hypothetical protein
MPLDAGRNRSLLLFKPHADVAAVRLQVLRKLGSHGVDVVGAGSVSLAGEGAADIVDHHFKNVSRNAVEIIPAYVQLSDGQKAAFLSFYGETWAGAVERGAVANAIDCCARLQASAAELGAAWHACCEQRKLVSLSEDMQCCFIDTFEGRAPVYCINGFYPAARAAYLAAPPHFLLLEFDEDAVSWSVFAEDIVGSPAPPAADKYSIRGQLLRMQKELQMKEPASGSNNFIHVSLSSFQCCADQMNWLRLPPEADPFGRLLLASGFSPDVLAYLAADPVIAGAPVFSHVEELDSGECLQTLQVLSRNPATATAAPAPAPAYPRP